MTSVGSAAGITWPALIPETPGCATLRSLPDSEEPKDDQDDDDGTDDVDDLMHETLLYINGSSDGTPGLGE